MLVYLDNSLNIQALLVCPAMSVPASLSVIVLSCNFSQPSVSSAQHATSALSLTAGCQWPTTWRQSVAQHTITSGRLDPHCNLCHVTLQRRSPGVHFQSPGLLQLSFVRRHRQLTSTTAVCMYRMLPPCGRVAVNTSHLFCRNCTGCLSDAVWTSN